MSRCQVPPTCFVPSCPADFVGQAGPNRSASIRVLGTHSFAFPLGGPDQALPPLGERGLISFIS